ncbi:phosphatidylinositol-3-phosphatase myotubularin-2-like isoform X2 [Brassica napus]|uniref:phosphatidylinositol-3-phosphatase myotubularin-2-like isoform X2 n=1 Tax=Brassica napus TaxID=3708 RepID=UPI0006AA69F3|nr:phosphatidylinositol-3-phosphatase myotubularin-2-like isoform X2 [Brassica napus]
MTAPRNSSRRLRSLRYSSEKMEGTGSWDVLEWTKLDQASWSSSYSNLDCLLDSERITFECCGVILINTNEAGTLLLTNFRILFLREGTRDPVPLGTIPLVAIEKFNKTKVQSNRHQSTKNPPKRLLQVTGKDMRIIVYGFPPGTKQRRSLVDALLRCSNLERVWDLYAFTCGPSKFGNKNPKERLLNEYFRLLGKGSLRASMNMIKDGSFSVSNDFWRITDLNSNYNLCPTYPFALMVPKSISDEELTQASTFRAKSRLPVISWCHPGTGAVIARSSQPLVGLMMNMRSNFDEKLVASFCTQLAGHKGAPRKLYIADARPRKNALANGAMGGGSESSSNYLQSEIVFFGIDNIHAMRESFSRLRDYLDMHGTTSSDGTSSFLRHGGWTWGGGNLSSMSASVSLLGESGWLSHIQSILAGVAWIAARVAMESASVLVHCSDGWDRTTQLVSLACLLLDPYYRTFAGFQALVEKDWLAFGHPFSDRIGMPNVAGSGSFELPIQSSSASSFPSSPVRQTSGSAATQSPGSSHGLNNYSPIFLQWVDCVSQLMRMYPCAFEFSPTFLVDFTDCLLSCRFGNFLCNSEKERQECRITESSGCLWAYLTDLRSFGGTSHAHCNPLYDPSRYNGALLPPAAALAPTLWPQFHLRWACPVEPDASETEFQCRAMSVKHLEMKKGKEEAERKVDALSSTVESLNEELRKERNISRAAKESAKRAIKERGVISRAVQSLGCKVNFTRSGDCTVEVEDGPQKCSHSIPHDVSESISSSVSEDKVCEALLCPLRAREGTCRWPDAGCCAQNGSQFVGLKANFEAFEKLSIYDSYFTAE